VVLEAQKVQFFKEDRADWAYYALILAIREQNSPGLLVPDNVVHNSAPRPVVESLPLVGVKPFYMDGNMYITDSTQTPGWSLQFTSLQTQGLPPSVQLRSRQRCSS